MHIIDNLKYNPVRTGKNEQRYDSCTGSNRHTRLAALRMVQDSYHTACPGYFITAGWIIGPQPPSAAVVGVLSSLPNFLSILFGFGAFFGFAFFTRLGFFSLFFGFSGLDLRAEDGHNGHARISQELDIIA